jgi:hypothetical protein
VNGIDGVSHEKIVRQGMPLDHAFAVVAVFRVILIFASG